MNSITKHGKADRHMRCYIAPGYLPQQIEHTYLHIQLLRKKANRSRHLRLIKDMQDKRPSKASVAQQLEIEPIIEDACASSGYGPIRQAILGVRNDDIGAEH